MQKLPRFHAWFGKDFVRGCGWSLGFWFLPKAEQGEGRLIRCALGVEITLRPGRLVRFYHPLRFAFDMNGHDSARWTGRDYTIGRVDLPMIRATVWN